MTNNNYKIPRYKLLTIGDEFVGKSCLVKRYCEKKFYDKYKPTIGVDYGTKLFEFNNKNIKIDFWDLSGSKHFIDIRKEFYNNTQILLAVFDVSDSKSLDTLDPWIKQIKQQIKQIIVIVAANKIDKSQREVSRKQIYQWCKQRNIDLFFETSSKTGSGIEHLFQTLFETCQKFY